MASGSSLTDDKMGDPLKAKITEDTPPQWLQHYMTKMKNEIKKEILEELLNISPDFRQVQIDQHLKTFAVGKEENLLQDQGEVVHSGIYCDNCDQLIHGIRYKCGNCSDFDLCQECESLSNVHNKNHIFLKIRYPFALKLYQKQKWQELVSPLSVKPSRFIDSAYSTSRSQSKKLYEAKFLCDETVPDSTVIPPSTRFVKSWKVMNSGTRVWTHATKLHIIQGSADLVPISQKVDVPHLKPGEEGIVSVLFTSPPLPGVYRSHWNFCHKSRPFGHIVWCHIIVKVMPEHIVKDMPEESNKQACVNELSDKEIVNKQVKDSIAQVLTAVKEEHEEIMVPRKLFVNSHTATPNNTPFALTPPKSPDHETLTKTVCEMATENNFLSQQNDSDNEDDECSVVSISSTDSETEFVVIPMPKCFNLSEPFMTQQHCLSIGTVESTVLPISDEVKETPVLKNTTKKSTPVSQETGVPELSENICEPLHVAVENLVGSQQSPMSQTASGGSSLEISIIESENSTLTMENATQTFDSINVTLSTNTSNSEQMNRVEVELVDEHSGDIETTSTIATTENVEVQEQSNIPGSATFPKFPIEGVTGEMYERPSSNNVNTEERTIQVLPEGLVIGALSAAASVYNTAKAVISTIQQPPPQRNENGDGPSTFQTRPQIVQHNIPVNPLDNLKPMDQLVEMGFCNRQVNELLLGKHNNDVALVVAELVNMSDNEWYTSRHIPSPPGFLD